MKVKVGLYVEVEREIADDWIEENKELTDEEREEGVSVYSLTQKGIEQIDNYFCNEKEPCEFEKNACLFYLKDTEGNLIADL